MEIDSDISFDLNDTNRAALCFEEAFIIAVKGDSNDIKPVGGYCIQVEPIGPQGREFLTHTHSSIAVDSYFSGTKLISSMTEKLQCLEEKRTKLFLYKEDGLHEKSLFMGLQEDTYCIKIGHARPWSVSTNYLQFYKHITNFISEGANVLLMRYLAMMNYEGTLHFTNIMISGEVVNSDYICTASQDMSLCGKRQKVFTVERRIFDKLTEHTRTYLTPEGRILVHEWLNTPYVMQRNPLTKQDETKYGTASVQIPLRERWMEDIEIFSKYLDAKSCNIAYYMDYLTDYPEIKQLIADYIQTLLVVKPVNVIDFTIQHFKAFAREPKIWDTDLLTDRSDSDINLQLMKERFNIKCNICGVCTECTKSQPNK